MEAYKKLSTAMEKSPIGQVICVGDLYIPLTDDLDMTEICVIDREERNRITACVTVHHLRRLGNANWAKADKDNEYPMTKNKGRRKDFINPEGK